MKHIYWVAALMGVFCLFSQVVESRPYDREKDWPETETGECGNASTCTPECRCYPQCKCRPKCHCHAKYYESLGCSGNLPGDGDFGEETSWPTNLEDSFYDSLTR